MRDQDLCWNMICKIRLNFFFILSARIRRANWRIYNTVILGKAVCFCRIHSHFNWTVPQGKIVISRATHKSKSVLSVRVVFRITNDEIPSNFENTYWKSPQNSLSTLLVVFFRCPPHEMEKKMWKKQFFRSCFLGQNRRLWSLKRTTEIDYLKPGMKNQS